MPGSPPAPTSPTPSQRRRKLTRSLILSNEQLGRQCAFHAERAHAAHACGEAYSSGVGLVRVEIAEGSGPDLKLLEGLLGFVRSELLVVELRLGKAEGAVKVESELLVALGECTNLIRFAVGGPSVEIEGDHLAQLVRSWPSLLELDIPSIFLLPLNRSLRSATPFRFNPQTPLTATEMLARKTTPFPTGIETLSLSLHWPEQLGLLQNLGSASAGAITKFSLEVGSAIPPAALSAVLRRIDLSRVEELVLRGCPVTAPRGARLSAAWVDCALVLLVNLSSLRTVRVDLAALCSSNLLRVITAHPNLRGIYIDPPKDARMAEGGFYGLQRLRALVDQGMLDSIRELVLAPGLFPLWNASLPLAPLQRSVEQLAAKAAGRGTQLLIDTGEGIIDIQERLVGPSHSVPNVPHEAEEADGELASVGPPTRAVAIPLSAEMSRFSSDTGASATSAGVWSDRSTPNTTPSSSPVITQDMLKTIRAEGGGDFFGQVRPSE